MAGSRRAFQRAKQAPLRPLGQPMPKHSADGLHEPLVAAGIGLSRPASPGSEGKELRSLASDGLPLAAMEPEPEPEVLARPA